MQLHQRVVVSKKVLVPVQVLLVCSIIWFHGQNAIVIGKGLERHIPTAGIRQINISNASGLAITAWEIEEVKLVARATPGDVKDQDIKVSSANGVIEIECSRQKTISLTLQVPSREIVNIKTYDGTIEIKDLVGTTFIDNETELSSKLSADRSTTVTYPKRVVRLETVPGASVNLDDVSSAFVCDYVQGSNPCRTASRRKVGSGLPRITFSQTAAKVNVFGPPFSAIFPVAPVARKLTFAAQTIAQHNNRIGRAIRQVEPRLSLPDRGSNNGKPVDTAKDEIELQTQLVNLSVSVTDRDGKAISGLSQNDFRVYENGVLQSISLFTSERTPFNLILLLDLSGSVEDRIGFIKAAAFHFLDVVGPQDSVGLVTFTSDVNIVSHLTTDREKLRAAIENLSSPIGGTAFYDAVGYTLVEEFSKVDGQRNAVVILSDGEDSGEPVRKRPPPAGSFLSYDELVDGAKEAGVIVYPIHLDYVYATGTIGLFTESPLKRRATKPGSQAGSNSSTAGQNGSTFEDSLTILAKKQMSDLADVTGGRFYHANLIAELKQVYDQIAGELRTIYSVAYKPADQHFDGKFRRIRMEVNKPDIIARTRQGYYAN